MPHLFINGICTLYNYKLITVFDPRMEVSISSYILQQWARTNAVGMVIIHMRFDSRYNFTLCSRFIFSFGIIWLHWAYLYFLWQFETFESWITFRLPSNKLAKRLWKISVEHHAFLRYVFIKYLFCLCFTEVSWSYRGMYSR